MVIGRQKHQRNGNSPKITLVRHSTEHQPVLRVLSPSPAPNKMEYNSPNGKIKQRKVSFEIALHCLCPCQLCSTYRTIRSICYNFGTGFIRVKVIKLRINLTTCLSALCNPHAVHAHKIRTCCILTRYLASPTSPSSTRTCKKCFLPKAKNEKGASS